MNYTINVMHLDGDLYESYIDSLFLLYDLIDVGGYVICDDCGSLFEADRAVDDFRSLHGIEDTLFHKHGAHADWQEQPSKCWRKGGPVEVRHDVYEKWKKTRQQFDLNMYWGGGFVHVVDEEIPVSVCDALVQEIYHWVDRVPYNYVPHEEAQEVQELFGSMLPANCSVELLDAARTFRRYALSLRDLLPWVLHKVQSGSFTPSSFKEAVRLGEKAAFFSLSVQNASEPDPSTLEVLQDLFAVRDRYFWKLDYHFDSTGGSICWYCTPESESANSAKVVD